MLSSLREGAEEGAEAEEGPGAGEAPEGGACGQSALACAALRGPQEGPHYSYDPSSAQEGSMKATT